MNLKTPCEITDKTTGEVLTCNKCITPNIRRGSKYCPTYNVYLIKWYDNKSGIEYYKGEK